MSNDSRTVKSVKNASTALLSKTVVLLLGLVSRTVFLKTLSVDYLGINGLFTNVLMILSFAELGIGNAIQYHMYKPVKEKKEVEVVSLLNLYKKAYYCVIAIIILVGAIITPNISYLIKDQPNILEDIRLIFFIYVINTASSYLFIYKQTILVADQNAYVINVANSISAIVLNALHIIILLLTRNYILFLTANTFCTIALNFVVAKYVDKNYPWIKEIQPQKLDGTLLKTIRSNIKDLMVSKVAGVACNGTDNIIISKMIGLSAVGFASNYTLIINSANGLVSSAITAITGNVGNLNVDSSVKHRGDVFHELMLTTYFVFSFISIGLVVLGDEFVRIVWGVEYIIPLPTTICLVAIVFQSGLNFAPYTFRVTKGYFRVMKYVYIGTAIINIGLSILFAKIWGMTGVFAATVISKALTSEIGDAYYSYKVICEKKFSRYWVLYGSYWLLATLTGIVCYMVNSLITNHSIGMFIIRGMICAALIILIDLLVFCRTRSFKKIVSRIRHIMPKGETK